MPANLGSTISWTGDVGGPVSAMGNQGASSYQAKFLSRVDGNLSFDLRHQVVEQFMGSEQDGSRYRARNHFWSARWTGIILAPVAELFKFSVDIDSDSSLQLRVGGVGNEFNVSQPGVTVLNISHGAAGDTFGFYNFSGSVLSREVVVEYAHFSGDPYLG